MAWILRLIIIVTLCSVDLCVSETTPQQNTTNETSQWSLWSACSTTCGEGMRRRMKQCNVLGGNCTTTPTETKHCFLRFCPSYLSWPRLHFSGTMISDVSSTNNFRCNFENKEFYSATVDYYALERINGTHKSYRIAAGNWNPDGSHHVYFQDTFVTSLCVSANNCSTNDPIVGTRVTETSRGVMVALDSDWQYASEIFGLKIRIPGILEGDFKPASYQLAKTRIDEPAPANGSKLISAMSRYKSVLTNLTWTDQHYKNMFHNATELSINLILDMYNQFTCECRVSGTIGLTSADDPHQATATRSLQVAEESVRGKAPFYIHHKDKIITIDLGLSLRGRLDGMIHASDVEKLDLAVLLPIKTFCKYYANESLSDCIGKSNETVVTKKLTIDGEISKHISREWYLAFGGVLDIDLTHIDRRTWKLLQKSRLALIRHTEKGDEIYMAEFAKGVVISFIDSPILRLNPGESAELTGFVSSFGRPVKDVIMEIFITEDHYTDTQCTRPSCNPKNAVPIDALQIVPERSSSMTNASGLIKFRITAKDPGNIRGCGLDGQIYPLHLYARYKTKTRNITFTDSGLDDSNIVADYTSTTLSTAIRVFSDIHVKKCPTWNDVKDIFIMYYNLYPVMWKTGIVDLHSYKQVKSKAKMLEVAMFETDFYSPRYMPISRDLSASKKKLIWNWMKCGMRKSDPSKKKIKSSVESCKTYGSFEKEVKGLRVLLQKAVMLELFTVPPYVTAWLSLKTEYGRNKKIASVLKSVFNEEMLHMTLAANILNAVGGRVNMTDETKLPSYPGTLASGAFFQLDPDMQVSLEPFSIGLVEEVFSKIEKPADAETRKVIHSLANVYKMLPIDEANTKSPSSKMQTLIRENNLQDPSNSFKDNSSLKNMSSARKNVLKTWQTIRRFAEQKLQKLRSLSMKTIGGFYVEIALGLASLESCLQIKKLYTDDSNASVADTIFTGSPSYQLNASHWYIKNSRGDEENKKGDISEESLFGVYGLKSALEAIVEIIYQGEGSSECSIFIKEDKEIKRGSETGHFHNTDVSHYYRFQEIANGRKLATVTNPPTWTDYKCINASGYGKTCPSLLNMAETYCYIGESIHFHKDGVWPILSNPKKEKYKEDSKAYKLLTQFNFAYTRLLFCLQDSFGGNPSNIMRCMSIMYDMTITGKLLVQTPLRVKDDTSSVELGHTGINGAPTWQFVRDETNRAGFPLYML